MPPTHEGPEVTGTVTDAAAAATGLRAGTPVVAGGGDQSANAVGVGAVSVGTMALSLGTSGVVFATTDRPLYEPHGRVHAFCHAVPGRWHLMSVMLSAAGSLRWFRDAVAPGVDVRRAGRQRGRGAGRQRRARLPALPVRRAEPAPRPAGPRGLRRAHPGPRSTSPHPGRPRGRRLRPARRARPDARGRDTGARPDPGVGWRHREPALAADPGRRARRRDRDGEHVRGRGLRGRDPRRGRRRLVPERRGGHDRPGQRDAGRRPGPGRRQRMPRRTPIYRDLYPALAPAFHRP